VVSTNRTIRTIAGSGAHAYSGDAGPALNAQFSFLDGITVDAAGNVYVADGNSNAVRGLQPTPTLSAVANGASFLSGSVAPGEIVVISGSGLGPANLVTGVLANPLVTFDGITADIIYAQASQVAAVVPDGLADNTSTRIQVQYQDQASGAITVLAPTARGLFTLDSSGGGQGLILSQDGSTNLSGNPADKGSIVSLFSTGAGEVDPQRGQPVLPLVVGINGTAAEVVSLASVPGLEGVIQINVRIPNDALPGNVPVVIEAGGAFSEPGVTVSVP
jgi:uncharacterized protein (TIGR03437 family)